MDMKRSKPASTVDPGDAPGLQRERFALVSEVRPIAGAIGAEILHVDLARLDNAQIAAIRAAWLRHLVIFFRDQRLTPAQLLAFAGRIGQPIEYPFLKGLDGFPAITPVVKLEHERVNFGGIWHTDTAYLERPPMGSMLLAREVPPRGGARCSPTCTWPTRRCRRVCGGCSTASSGSTHRPRPTSPRPARTA